MKQISVFFNPLKPLPKQLLAMVTLIVSCYAPASFANSQTDDTKQPVEILADQLVSNEKQGQSIYQGSVNITQGSFNLIGDKVVIAHPNGQLQTVLATGSPAKFKQFNPSENAWVNGQAAEIFYDANAKTVKLSGNALVEQENKHQIKGENLVYDITNQTLQGNGSQQQRIQVILQPNSEPDTSEGQN